MAWEREPYFEDTYAIVETALSQGILGQYQFQSPIQVQVYTWTFVKLARSLPTWFRACGVMIKLAKGWQCLFCYKDWLEGGHLLVYLPIAFEWFVTSMIMNTFHMSIEIIFLSKSCITFWAFQCSYHIFASMHVFKMSTKSAFLRKTESTSIALKRSNTFMNSSNMWIQIAAFRKTCITTWTLQWSISFMN